MSEFWKELQSQEGTGAQALQFLILTAARSNEVRGARWDEVDTQAKLWTIPASRMKTRREHVVPLGSATVELLEARPRESDLIFPAPRGGVLSDMTLCAVLRPMGIDATVHGFRSVFRTWSAEHTAYPREVLEQALAHTLGPWNRPTIARRVSRNAGGSCAIGNASSRTRPSLARCRRYARNDNGNDAGDGRVFEVTPR